MSKGLDVKAKQTSVKSFFTTKTIETDKTEVPQVSTTSPSIFDKYKNIVSCNCY